MPMKIWSDQLPVVRSRVAELVGVLRGHVEHPEGIREETLAAALGHATALARESRDLAKALLEASCATREHAEIVASAKDETLPLDFEERGGARGETAARKAAKA